MKLIAALKLKTTQEQHQALLATLERANDACNYISRIAWKEDTFRKYPLHKLTYYSTKERFGLTAQVVIRCIAKVVDAYKLNRGKQWVFRPHGSIAYDSRILRYAENTVSIWTVDGRKQVPFECGEYQRQMLKTQQGESDLVYRNGGFYLHAVCNVDEIPADNPESFFGIGLATADNIAAAN